MTGGYISSTGKTRTLQDLLTFILTEYKLKYKAYIANVNNVYVFRIEIIMKDTLRLLWILSDKLQEMEDKIMDTLHNVTPVGYKIEIIYKEP